MYTIIKINMDNAAFADGEHSFEAARILRELADRIERHPCFLPGHVIIVLRDYNGNDVGFCQVEEGSIT